VIKRKRLTGKGDEKNVLLHSCPEKANLGPFDYQFDRMAF